VAGLKLIAKGNYRLCWFCPCGQWENQTVTTEAVHIQKLADYESLLFGIMQVIRDVLDIRESRN
jgi:hypothetical protein